MGFDLKKTLKYAAGGVGVVAASPVLGSVGAITGAGALVGISAGAITAALTGKKKEGGEDAPLTQNQVNQIMFSLAVIATAGHIDGDFCNEEVAVYNLFASKSGLSKEKVTEAEKWKREPASIGELKQRWDAIEDEEGSFKEHVSELLRQVITADEVVDPCEKLFQMHINMLFEGMTSYPVYAAQSNKQSILNKCGLAICLSEGEVKSQFPDTNFNDEAGCYLKEDIFYVQSPENKAELVEFSIAVNKDYRASKVQEVFKLLQMLGAKEIKSLTHTVKNTEAELNNSTGAEAELPELGTASVSSDLSAAASYLSGKTEEFKHVFKEEKKGPLSKLFSIESLKKKGPEYYLNQVSKFKDDDVFHTILTMRLNKCNSLSESRFEINTSSILQLQLLLEAAASCKLIGSFTGNGSSKISAKGSYKSEEKRTFEVVFHDQG